MSLYPAFPLQQLALHLKQQLNLTSVLEEYDDPHCYASHLAKYNHIQQAAI